MNTFSPVLSWQYTLLPHFIPMCKLSRGNHPSVDKKLCLFKIPWVSYLYSIVFKPILTLMQWKGSWIVLTWLVKILQQCCGNASLLHFIVHCALGTQFSSEILASAKLDRNSLISTFCCVIIDISWSWLAQKYFKGNSGWQWFTCVFSSCWQAWN